MSDLDGTTWVANAFATSESGSVSVTVTIEFASGSWGIAYDLASTGGGKGTEAGTYLISNYGGYSAPDARTASRPIRYKLKAKS